MLLKGKVAVVTGGSRGIGFATVKAYLENGASVLFFGSKQETVDAALAKLKAIDASWDVEGQVVNLSDYDAMKAAYTGWAAKHGGRLDIAIHNAGISPATKLHELTVDQFRHTYDVNTTSVFVGCKVAAEIMSAQEGAGVILNTASYTAAYGAPTGCDYPSSKGAVHTLTRGLARELGPDGIRVCAVAPGVTRTDMVASLPQEWIKPLEAKAPLKKLVEPEDIANAFLFLGSDMAKSVTGVTLHVDAGGTNY